MYVYVRTYEPIIQCHTYTNLVYEALEELVLKVLGALHGSWSTSTVFIHSLCVHVYVHVHVRMYVHNYACTYVCTAKNNN